MRRLMSGSVPIMLGMVFSFLGTALVARLVGPAVFGEYTFLLTWISVAALLSKAGHEWVLLKIIPGRLKIGALGQIRFLIRKTFTAVALRAVAATTILAILAALTGRWTDPVSMAAGLTLVLVMAFSELRRSWALAHRAVWLSDAPENIAKSLVLAGSVAALLSWGVEVQARTLLILNLGVTLFTALAATLIFLKAKTPWLLITPRERLPKELDNNYDLVRTMWFTTALNISLRNLDLIVVGVMTNAVTTGLYATATRLGQLAAAPVMIMERIIIPTLSEATENNKQKKILVVSRNYVLLTSFSSMTIMIIFLFFGSDLISLIYGENYLSILPLTLIILGGNMFGALAGPANLIMTVSGAHRQSSIITSAAGIANLALIFILTHFFSAIGAAIATAMAIGAKGWASAIWVRLSTNLDTTILGLKRR